MLNIELDDRSDRIVGGTSGAPVFDDAGRVLAIVTNTRVDHPELTAVWLATVLPWWVLIDEAEHNARRGRRRPR
jgi:hypothetical protein